MKLSVVILTRNEEGNITECIDSVRFADEVVVIDDESTDNTRKIARKVGAKVFLRKLNSDFAAQRNYGLKKADGDWILFVDADERVSKVLASEIVQVINDPILKYEGYRLKRADFMWGNLLEHQQDRFHPVRLARKGSGEWVRRVHEIWAIKGQVRTLSNHLLHYPHQTLREFLQEINNYSTVNALTSVEENRRSSTIKVIIWPIGKFLENWIFWRGFLDGTRGFLIAIMMAFHSFLSWSKLWLKQREN